MLTIDSFYPLESCALGYIYEDDEMRKIVSTEVTISENDARLRFLASQVTGHKVSTAWR